MKSSEATAAFIRDMIESSYERPDMVGRKVGENDTLIECLHFIWADLSEHQSEFNSIRIEELAKITDRPALGVFAD